MEPRSVPTDWIHPDLRRAIVEEQRRTSADQLAQVEACSKLLYHGAEVVYTDAEQTWSRVETLRKKLRMAEEAYQAADHLREKARRIHGEVSTQLLLQRAAVPALADPRVVQRDTFISQCVSAGGAASSSNNTNMSLLDVHFHHLFANLLAPPHPPYGVEAITRFLREVAPLCRWSAEDSRVQLHLLLDEPCLMEKDGDHSCSNVGCVYWHRDQLHHLKQVFLRVVGHAHPWMVNEAPQLCAVARFFSSYAFMVNAATSIHHLCTYVCGALQSMIDVGWHTLLLQASTQSKAVWLAPIATSAPRCSFAALEEELLRDAMEQRQWQATLLGGPHPMQQLTTQPTPIGWRCVLRSPVVQTPNQRLWLAEQGTRFFPGSPHLWVHLLMAMIATRAEVESCAVVCLRALRALAEEVKCSSPASTALAARYAAFMVATCVRYGCSTRFVLDAGTVTDLLKAVLMDEDEDEEREDGAGVTTRNEESEATMATPPPQPQPSSSSSSRLPPPPPLLLPIAVHNLMLMLVVLQERPGCVVFDDLPLGAVSDQLWMLAAEDAVSHTTHRSTRRRLNRLISESKRLQQDGSECEEMAEQLKTSAQLSLLRSYSSSLLYVAQIVAKVGATSTTAQADLLLEYLRAVDREDHPHAADEIAAALIDATHGQSSCLLTLLLVWRLEQAGRSVGAHVEAALHAHEVEVPTLEKKLTARRRPNTISAVEWAARNLLVARCIVEEPVQQLDVLEKLLPLREVASDADAQYLLLCAEMKLAAAAQRVDLFRCILRRHLIFAREWHLHVWSPLDVWYEDVVSHVHLLTLRVYALVPLILGARGEDTLVWRCAVLEVGLDLKVLHPLLREEG